MWPKSKYVGLTVTHENWIHKDLRQNKSENSCYHSVQNLLFSRLLSNKFRNIRVEKQTWRIIVCKLKKYFCKIISKIVKLTGKVPYFT
jgi:hypothetical protein